MLAGRGFGRVPRIERSAGAGGGSGPAGRQTRWTDLPDTWRNGAGVAEERSVEIEDPETHIWTRAAKLCGLPGHRHIRVRMPDIESQHQAAQRGI